MVSLNNISPIDGRYQYDTRELSLFFSEEALIKYRIKIEIEYLIALSNVLQIKELKPLSSRKKSDLRSIYEKFSTKDAQKIKRIEAKTNHDVKAVEYFIQNKFKKIGQFNLVPFIHFALTSEDINNLAYSLMWRDGLHYIYIPLLKKTMSKIRSLSKAQSHTAMLSLTHGQPATPTTLGKEFAVYYNRLNRQLINLKKHKLLGKLGGATGTWSAHIAAYQNVDWLKFTEKFIKSLKLEPNLVTTQIESHDSLIESYQTVQRVNSILIDFCQDNWLYISRGVFKQKRIAKEVGSSTMPHKINPINFENAEGNLGLSSSMFSFLSSKLPISRMQRDLSDSTVLRNQGVALAHSLLALKNILKGLDRLSVDKVKTSTELAAHWEVLAEAIQTVLRKNGQTDAYEKLKDLTRGENISQEVIAIFIKSLKLSKDDENFLLMLSPTTNIGLSTKLVELI